MSELKELGDLIKKLGKMKGVPVDAPACGEDECQICSDDGEPSSEDEELLDDIDIMILQLKDLKRKTDLFNQLNHLILSFELKGSKKNTPHLFGNPKSIVFTLQAMSNHVLNKFSRGDE